MQHVDLETRRFTRDEVLKMVEAGILGEDEPLELLEGRLVLMTPQGPEHGYSATTLRDRLQDAYRGRAFIREDKPLDCGAENLPEPDLAAVPGIPRDFVARHPTAAETLLVVEIARTSQRVDREKAMIYARGGAQTYWLLDLAARRLEVRADPTPDGRYAVVRVLDESATAVPPKCEAGWTVGELLP